MDDFRDHLPEALGMKPGAERFPLMVLPSVSNACNSRCLHCWYTANPELRKRDGVTFMPEGLLRRIVDEVAEHTDPRPLIRVTGTGEPFLMPSLTDLLVEACAGKGVRAAVITNGSLVTPERSERLIAAGIEAIECSVDAADKETYERVRRGLKFDDILRNVEHMLAARDRLGASTKILVSVVDNPEQIDAAQVAAFWEERVDRVITRKYLTYGQLSKDLYSKDTYLPPEDRVPCPYPFERLVILASGQTTFCNFDVEDSFYMGNINDRTIEEVWRGRAFEAWRKLVVEGRFEEVPLCAKCEDWKYKSWTHNFFKVLREAGGERESTS